MGEKTAHDLLVDAVLLARFYDFEPECHDHNEAKFLAEIRRDYPEHVDEADWVVRRVLKAQAADPSPALSREGDAK